MLNLDPIDGKFTAFGMKTQVINGNDMREVLTALERAAPSRVSPPASSSLTHKGQGILNLLRKLGDTNFHGKPVPAEVPRRGPGRSRRRRRVNRPTELDAAIRCPRSIRMPDQKGESLMAGASSALQTKRELGKATRDAFGRALEALGADHPEVVVVDGDVGNSTRTEWFGKKHPDRFFNVGIAESNLVGVAAGLAASGKTSVIASFAAFIMCNAYDQLRMSVAYPGLNVKVVGSHAGISIGEDGASQMGIEDVALACALPGFVVIVPADDVSAQAATAAMLEYKGPVYLRVGRPEVPRIYPAGSDAVPDRQGQLTPRGHRPDDRRQRPDGCPGPRRCRDAGRRGDLRPACSTCTPSSRSIATPSSRRGEGDRCAGRRRGTPGTRRPGQRRGHDRRRVHPVPIRFVNLGDTVRRERRPDALLEKYGLTAGKVADAARAAVVAKKN